MLTAPKSFDRDGFVLHRGAATAVLPALESILGSWSDRPGARLWNVAGLDALLCSTGPLGALAARGASGWQPVRAIQFNKSAVNNWGLGWHQDRTIVVRERIAVPGFGPWTVKAGLQHVAPPIAVLAGMVTIRVHLDSVPRDNAPLLVAPGSHRLGRVAEADIPRVVARLGVRCCLAEPGDVWCYATPILHASDAAAIPGRRRVLQVDYAAGRRPGGLEWLGIGD